MMDWLLKQARVAGHESLVDVGIAEGKIAAIAPHLDVAAAQMRELAGRVLLPGLVDLHTHLDKTYASIANREGTLREAIRLWGEIRPTRTAVLTHAAATKALKTAVGNGVTALRTHVDISDDHSLATLDAILTVRDEWRDVIDMQVVALGSPGGTASQRAALTAALARGVDFVGGAPALTADPRADIDAAFALAEQFGKPLDLHIDETEDPNVLTLAYLAEQTVARGMVGKVTAGHCCSLAFVGEETAVRVMEKVAKAAITVVTLPSCNLNLMGRGMMPAPRGATPVKQLLAHGVNVCAASDNVHDPFNPFGSYDLLQIANLNAHVAHMTSAGELAESLAMVTTRPARAMGLGGGEIGVGKTADLVVVDCESLLEAVVSLPTRLATFKGGRLVVETAVRQTWRI